MLSSGCLAGHAQEQDKASTRHYRRAVQPPRLRATRVYSYTDAAQPTGTCTQTEGSTGWRACAASAAGCTSSKDRNSRGYRSRASADCKPLGSATPAMEWSGLAVGGWRLVRSAVGRVCGAQGCGPHAARQHHQVGRWLVGSAVGQVNSWSVWWLVRPAVDRSATPRLRGPGRRRGDVRHA